MTRRLQYTRDAFLRRVAMSYDTSIFVLVEGKVFDPYFAEKTCTSSDRLANQGYEIRIINQIKTNSGRSSGGKEAVISFFDYCKKTGKLRQRNGGGDRVVAFIVDRDAQHVTGGMRRSPHLLYTIYADVEAHIFFEADEVASLSLAASLDKASATDLVQAIGNWRTEVADMWRPWIELCYIADATHSRCWVGLASAQSLIHSGKRCSTLNDDKLKAAKKAVRAGSLLTNSQFDLLEAHVMSKVASIYSKDKQASLLKGKWLPGQLTLRVGDYFKNASADGYEWYEKGFRESAARCYAANLRLNSPGIRKLRTKLEALL